MPLVSIVMPTFNAIDFLADSVESVIVQSFTDWELLVVDDGSTDGTVDWLRTIADPRIKVLMLSLNSGPAVARNTAIRQAQGRYIAFLDADDIWLPFKLSRQLSFMKEHQSPFSYTGYEKIDEEGTTIGCRTVPRRTTYNGLLANNVVGCLTAMYDTAKCGKVEMPLIRKRQDLGLWLRLARMCDRVDGVQEVLAQYRVRKGSVSANKMVAARYTWQLYRQIEKVPLPKALLYFSRYALGGVLRR